MVASLQDRYQQEKEKRINIKGLSQYLDNSHGTLYALNVDPWVETGTQVHEPVPDGGHCKVLIFGAGISGLCAAIRCLESGAAPTLDDILIVDPAGGFGGTWWWNRFPGLMCDIESYIYLPLLEKTGYMPKRKYASGNEIREYMELLADKYHLHKRAMFQSSGKSLTWDSDHWNCAIVEKPKGLPEKTLKITTDFVMLASGGFTYPKLPALPGLPTFKGKMLHTARWNYEITGGSSADPVLTGLSGKKVALVGTGATAIQAVPHVAKYAGELYVFQRTASAVDIRNNHDTDPQVWKTKIATKKGWQEERADNFQAFMENVPVKPEVDLVSDGWTDFPSISAAWGGNIHLTSDDVPRLIEEMHEHDARRSQRVRKRTEEIVKDPETAKSLQAWYPGWCKRPCFHDDYLPSFNLPNVKLIDTDGAGLTDLTPTGIIANGQEYPIDIIIWSTGYGSPLKDSLAGKAEMTVTGRNGQDMDEVFKAGDLGTLHGMIAHGFPNLFMFGLAQAGVPANQTQRIDRVSSNMVHIIVEAERRVGDSSKKKVIVEPTEAACVHWGDRVASHAWLFANMAGCLPSYFNNEGEIQRAPPEAQAKLARNVLWGQGFNQYSKVIKEWRERGDLEGIEVTSV